MSEQRLMKDGLNRAAIDRIAQALTAVITEFPKVSFTDAALDGLENLELKERVAHLIEVLSRFLPDEYPVAAEILQKVPDHWDYGDPDDSMRGFAAWPLIDYSAAYGMEHPEAALRTLKRLTSLFSAEMAIRPFVVEHYEQTMESLHRWSQDEDYHVRRLVSEGTRPRLPWAMRLSGFVEDPAPVLPLLEALKDDPEEYVRRSVANHLNDISKDHPAVTIDVCANWLTDAGPERMRLIRHATRTLVKQGHPDVWALLGFEADPDVAVEALSVEPDTIRLGQSITVSFCLRSLTERPQKLVLDYAVHHVKASGSLTAKVFKWTTLELGGGESREMVRRHPIRPITTRRYYSGEHQVDVRVNGQASKCASFMLEVPE